MVDAPISGAPTPTIAVFAHDAGESTVVKRVMSFQACGAHVIGFMFRRERRGNDRSPGWENVDFGSTVDRNYLARLPKLIIAIVRMIGRRCDIRRCAFIYARNIDMLTVALAAKWLSGTSAPVAYEVLDVQRVFTDKGLVGAIFRWAERVLLRRCDLLVVSSPMFITKYFEPIQAYTGSWYLLENIISEFQIPVAGQSLRPNRKAGPPWIIGWFGTLRCARSLKILSDLAEAFPDKVVVHIRGRPSEEDISEERLFAATTGRANFRYFGPYRSPEDLGDIYGEVHFTWSIDLLDAGTNSDWLLPNRLYEGGLYNSVAIARSGTATGEMVMREKLGEIIQDPLYESLAAFISGLTIERYEALAERSRQASRSIFIDANDTRTLFHELCRGREAEKNPRKS